ncbi:hypothetical protein VTK56DRAFT_3750 [Thermocarpiscus australiensis]
MQLPPPETVARNTRPQGNQNGMRNVYCVMRANLGGQPFLTLRHGRRDTAEFCGRMVTRPTCLRCFGCIFREETRNPCLAFLRPGPSFPGPTAKPRGRRHKKPPPPRSFPVRRKEDKALVGVCHNYTASLLGTTLDATHGTSIMSSGVVTGPMTA